MFYSHIIDDALEIRVKGGPSQAVFDATAATLVVDGKVLTRQYLSQRRKS
jgi:hypothetical protein